MQIRAQDTTQAACHTHTPKEYGEGQTVGKRYCRKLLAEIGVTAIENAFGPRLKKCHNLCKRRKQSNEPKVAESNNNTLTHAPTNKLSHSLTSSLDHLASVVSTFNGQISGKTVGKVANFLNIEIYILIAICKTILRRKKLIFQ